jgi:hypothetical protein
MPTNLHWHMPEYAPRPIDAAGPSTLTANNKDTSHKLTSSHIAATTALVCIIAPAMPAAPKQKSRQALHAVRKAG